MSQRLATVDVATYQRRIVELVADNKKAAAEIEKLRQRHAIEVRQLKAMQRDSISPALIAAHKQIRRLEAECDRLRRQLSEKRHRALER